MARTAPGRPLVAQVAPEVGALAVAVCPRRSPFERQAQADRQQNRHAAEMVTQ